jgi:hypothetical protein
MPAALRLIMQGNRILVDGAVTLDSFRDLLVAIEAIADAIPPLEVREVELDFGACTSAEPGAMAAVAAHAAKLRSDGLRIRAQLPTKLQLRNVFARSGWAFHLDAKGYASAIHGRTRVPLTSFATPAQQGDLVNRAMDALLKSGEGMNREDFGAIEWVINELADNVLAHSDSPLGGFIQLENFPARKRVELLVADAGVGIPKTLRGTNAEIRTDSDALGLAIRPGVKGYASIGQGSGLHGAYLIAESSAERLAPGREDTGPPMDRTQSGLAIHSGLASLEVTRGVLKLRSERIPYKGTLVVAGLDYSRPGLLANALQFGGKPLVTTDLIELKYEMDKRGAADFDMSAEADSFGSRAAGVAVRVKILNLCRMGRDIRSITVDMSRVAMMGSNFADEVFGKLYLEMGKAEFVRRIVITGANESVQALIDYAVSQRNERTE